MAARRGVVVIQRFAQTLHLDTHDTVRRGIEIRPPVQHILRDRVSFDPVRPPLDAFGHNVRQDSRGVGVAIFTDRIQNLTQGVQLGRI